MDWNMKQIPLRLKMEEDVVFFFCGYHSTPPEHRIGPSVWDYYLIHIVHKGKGIVRTNNKEYMLEQGDGFVIYPNVISYYASDIKLPWEYSWIAVKGHGIKKILSRANISPDNNKFRHHNFDFFKYFSIGYENTININMANMLLIKSNFYSFFAQLINLNKKEKKKTNKDIKKIYIQAVENIINTNFHNRITVEQIANQVGLNISYLGKLFKSEKGISIKNYLINIRMKRACELLKSTDYQISDISRSAGYMDQLQFAKIFRKYKSVSPTDYRVKNSMLKNE